MSMTEKSCTNLNHRQMSQPSSGEVVVCAETSWNAERRSKDKALQSSIWQQQRHVHSTLTTTITVYRASSLEGLEGRLNFQRETKIQTWL